MEESKSLGHDDESGFLFAKEMLCGDPTAAINFDRLMRHPKNGYIIMEYLLCEENQMYKHGISPYSSHPNRYWNKNRRKFLALWRATLDLQGTLYLVNYAKKGTKFQDEILLLTVTGMNENSLFAKEERFTRKTFQEWFRNLNKQCIDQESSILAKKPIYIYGNYYHNNRNCDFIRNTKGYMVCDETEYNYYKNKYKPCKKCYPQI